MMKRPTRYLAFAWVMIMTTAVAGSAMEGRAWGDIHVQTMDGAKYDFQSAGEFVASRSTDGDFEVQLRLESSGFSPNVSVATAVAVLVDSTRASVSLGREPMLFVEQQPAVLTDGSLDLPDGGRIEQSKRGYEIYWSDGSVLSVDVRKRHLNAFLRPAEIRRGRLHGLFGNFNGVAADDVEAALASLGSAGNSQLNAAIADWAQDLLTEDEHDPRLLEQDESLFEYKPGQNTHSFRRPAPAQEASVAALPAGSRKQARKTCEEAGVTDADLLEACIVDVGYTRDDSFAETAMTVQERDVANWDSAMAKRTDAGL